MYHPVTFSIRKAPDLLVWRPVWIKALEVRPCLWLHLSPGEGNVNPLQHSCLENLMDRGAWWAKVHGIAEWDTTEQLTHKDLWVRRDALPSGAVSASAGGVQQQSQGQRFKCFLLVVHALNWKCYLLLTWDLFLISSFCRRQTLVASSGCCLWPPACKLASDSMDMSLSKVQEIMKGREAWCAVVHGISKSLTQFSDWTKTTNRSFTILLKSL